MKRFFTLIIITLTLFSNLTAQDKPSIIERYKKEFTAVRWKLNPFSFFSKHAKNSSLTAMDEVKKLELYNKLSEAYMAFYEDGRFEGHIVKFYKSSVAVYKITGTWSVNMYSQLRISGEDENGKLRSISAATIVNYSDPKVPKLGFFTPYENEDDDEKLDFFAAEDTKGKATSLNSFEGRITYDFVVEGDNAELAAAFSPTGFDLYAKQDRVAWIIHGGLYGTIFPRTIFDCTNNLAYILNDAMTTAGRMAYEDYIDMFEPMKEKPIYRKTGKTKIIKGYKCFEVTAKMGTKKGLTNASYWISDAVKLPKPKFTSPFQAIFFFETRLGTVLEVSTKYETGLWEGVTSHIRVKEIYQTSLPTSIFTVPKNYEKKTFTGDE
ncbi:MAG: hypothetical protein ACPGJS_11135 [Flammeovirgaceae bacterium]